MRVWTPADSQSSALFTSVVVGTLIPFSVLAQTYPIRLDPHEKAGQTYHVEATTTDSTTAEATVPAS